jgi:hypothetical protein
MSADPADRNSLAANEARLWAAVQRAHAVTTFHRLGDDPEAQPALKEWEAAYLAGDQKGVAVIPFPGRRT